MTNTLEKQSESIAHVDTILQGIHKIDRTKVKNGVKELRKINFKDLETPLAPFFDLATGLGHGLSHGREDFLALELKHLLSIVIRQMAQGTYRWAQQKNKIITEDTKDLLREALSKPSKLLDPTQEPCVSAKNNFIYAEAIVSCIKIPTQDEEAKRWEQIMFVTEVLAYVGDSVLAKKPTLSIGLTLLQRGYSYMQEAKKINHDQQLVMQMAVLDAWKIIIDPSSQTEQPLTRQVEKTIATFKEYVEKEGGENTKKSKQSDEARRTFKDYVSTSIKKIEEKVKTGEEVEIKKELQNLAFYALVDLYAKTKHESVQCEILKTFGEMAKGLCQKLSEDQLRSAMNKESINNNDIEDIEIDSLRILIEAIWPTQKDQKEQDSPDTFKSRLSAEEATKLSEKWMIQCTAIEELLRFEAHYIKNEKSKRGKDNTKDAEPITPIRSFLDAMGSEYRMTTLFRKRFDLDEPAVTTVRDFLDIVKKVSKAKQVLDDLLFEDASDPELAKFFEEEVIDVIQGQKDYQKEHLNYIYVSKKEQIFGQNSNIPSTENFVKEFKSKIKDLCKQGDNTQNSRSPKTNQWKNFITNIKKSQLDSNHRKFLDLLIEAGMNKEKKNVKKILTSKLVLDEKEAHTLITFLLQGKKDEQDQAQQEEKYSKDANLRAVLDKLIDKFELIQEERDFIDKTVFRGQIRYTAPKPWREKLGKSLQGLFGKDHSPKISCAFNNLDRIREMIKAEIAMEEQEKTGNQQS